jgi:hypothetical protein
VGDSLVGSLCAFCLMGSTKSCGQALDPKEEKSAEADQHVGGPLFFFPSLRAAHVGGALRFYNWGPPFFSEPAKRKKDQRPICWSACGPQQMSKSVKKCHLPTNMLVGVCGPLLFVGSSCWSASALLYLVVHRFSKKSWWTPSIKAQRLTNMSVGLCAFRHYTCDRRLRFYTWGPHPFAGR